MLIKIKHDSLVFTDLSNEQLDFLLKASTKCEMKETEKTMIVYGKKEHLYQVLYTLSKDYDIELT